MLACSHDSPMFGSPMYEHLRVLQDRAVPYVNWYSGAGLNAELLCFACAGRREQGASVDVAHVCEECFEEIITEHGGPERSGGNPEIHHSRSLNRAHTLSRFIGLPGMGAGGHGVCWSSGKIFHRRSFTFLVEQGWSVAVVC